MTTIDIIITSFVLVFLISFDVIALGFGFGIERKRMPLGRLVIVSAIGNALLFAVLLLGYFTEPLVSDDAVMWTVFTLFVLVGIMKLATWVKSKYFAKAQYEKTRDSMFVPKVPSWRETVLLALLLAIDGLGIGFASGLAGASLYFLIAIVAISFVADILLFRAGELLARLIPARRSRNLGWVSGVILIVLGVVGLFI